MIIRDIRSDRPVSYGNVIAVTEIGSMVRLYMDTGYAVDIQDIDLKFEPMWILRKRLEDELLRRQDVEKERINDSWYLGE